ncbi:MAG: AAA family ATPase [Candidatus Aenigmatarchaeota archaeon]
MVSSNVHYIDQRKAMEGLSELGACKTRLYEGGWGRVTVEYRGKVSMDDVLRVMEYTEKFPGNGTGGKLTGTKKSGYHLIMDGDGIMLSFSRKTDNKRDIGAYFENNPEMRVTITADKTGVYPQRIGHAWGIWQMLETKKSLTAKDAIYQFCKSLVRRELHDINKSDIGGLDREFEEIMSSTDMQLFNPAACRYFGLEKTNGILLVGPPGNGKSIMMAAIAKETEANVLLLDPNDVASYFHNETEANIHKLFIEAEQMSKDTDRPVIMMCDEAERLMYDRAKTNQWDLLVTNAMLREFSSLGTDKNITFLGATNMPWEIDPAFYRQGRIEKVIYVPSPGNDAKKAILKAQTRAMPIKDVNLDEIADRTDGWSGADLKSLCNQAAKFAVERIAGDRKKFRKLDVNELIRNNEGVMQQDFDKARPIVKVNEQQQKEWEKNYDMWKGKGIKPPENLYR